MTRSGHAAVPNSRSVARLEVGARPYACGCQSRRSRSRRLLPCMRHGTDSLAAAAFLGVDGHAVGPAAFFQGQAEGDAAVVAAVGHDHRHGWQPAASRSNTPEAGVDPGPSNAGLVRRWTVDYVEALHLHSAGGADVNMMMAEGQERVRIKAGPRPGQRLPAQPEHPPGCGCGCGYGCCVRTKSSAALTLTSPGPVAVSGPTWALLPNRG